MNDLVSSIGSAVLSQLRNAAEGLGCTEFTAPTSITYCHDKSQTYDPDTGYTATWGSTASITDVLIGGYDWKAITNVETVNESDIQVLFQQSEISSIPEAGDQVTYNSNTYDYVHHRAAADLYLIHMSLHTGAP